MSVSQPRVWAVAMALMRWIMAGLFIYMGLKKALEPVLFLKLTRQYDLVHDPMWLNFIAATLPWFEVVCGLLLLMGIAVRGTALVLIAELIPFTALVWHRALQLQLLKGIPFCMVKFDCGCGAGEIYICHKLLENGLLIATCGWLMASRSQLYCLRSSLFRS